MKVAIVCPYAWDRFGGVQSHVRSLARSLRRRDHEVTVLAPQASGSDIDAEEWVRIVGRAVAVPANGSMAPVSFGPLAAQNVRATLEQIAPEICHLHEPLIPSLSLLALRVASCPTVGTFHASADSSFGYRAATPWLERSIQRLTVRTVVSQAAADLISRYFPGDYLSTPNGVEVSIFSGARPLNLGRKPRILFFSRIEARKGLDVLVEAMTFLRDLDATLVVAGSGPLERSSATRARRLGIEARFLGRPSEGDKPGIFVAADVYCAPGLGGESFGIVLVEAMAAGTPVVCSDLPAFRAVASEAACLVPPDEPRALAAGLRKVLTDGSYARRLTASGSLIAREYDWDRLASGVEKSYELALERGRVG